LSKQYSISYYIVDKHDKDKAEKERLKQIEKENAEKAAREVSPVSD
jgi:hypothetical protein